MKKLLTIFITFLMAGMCYSQNVTQTQLRRTIDTLARKRQIDSLSHSLDSSIVKLVTTTTTATINGDTLTLPNNSVASYHYLVEVKDDNMNVGSAEKFITLKNINGSVKIIRDYNIVPFASDNPTLQPNLFLTQTQIGANVIVFVRLTGLNKNVYWKLTKTQL